MASYLRAAARRNKVDELARGLGDEPVRPPPLRALLQDVQREGLGRARVRDPRRVGGAAHQGAVVLLRREGRVLRQQGQQGQEPDLGVQLPALRARADVGRDDGRDRGAGRRGAARVARRRGSSSPAAASSRSRPAATSYTLPDAVISSLPLREVVEMVSPRAAAGGARRRARPALPRLPHRRARRRRRGSLPRQLDLHPRAERARRPHPELPLVVAVDGPRPRQGVRRPRVLLLRRRRPLDDGRRRRSSSSPRASSSSSASRRARRSSAASRSACRRRTRSTTPTTRSASRSIRALARRDREPAAGRPQRPAPLQQLGPLDADGDARGRQPARRCATTTSGRSTRRASTTRPTSRTSIRTARLPRRPRCRRSPPPAPIRQRRSSRRGDGRGRLLLVWLALPTVWWTPLNVDEELTLRLARLLVPERLPHRLDAARRRPAALLARALPAGLVAGPRGAARARRSSSSASRCRPSR